MSRGNPFVPVFGEIQRGNADLVCEAAPSVIVAGQRAEMDVSCRDDQLVGRELTAASAAYGAVLLSIARPEAPEPLA